jgi:hypothetical protein
MTEFEHFKRALALTESEANPFKFGDAGRACGKWQMHPEFFSDYYPGAALPGETWDEWFERALMRFWLNRRGSVLSVFSLAQMFHLGHAAYVNGGYDTKYDADFAGFWHAVALQDAKTAVS